MGIWDLGSILVSFSRTFGTPVGEHGAGRCRHNNNKNEFGGVKNLIFWPQLRALPQLRELRKPFKELHGHFTATSQQLHMNFAATSRELHTNFTNFTSLHNH